MYMRRLLILLAILLLIFSTSSGLEVFFTKEGETYEKVVSGPQLMQPNPLVYAKSPMRQLATDYGTRGTSTQGSQDVISLLVEFTNVSHDPSNTKSHFEDLLFSQAGSMHDYFDEVSYGTLNVNGNLTSWLRVDNTMKEYGEDSSTGIDDANGPVYRLVTDAVHLADPFVDFSKYDIDGDGIVDHLLVIHAGEGQESDRNPNLIWSHRWAVMDADLSTPGRQKLIADGVEIYWYTMDSEFSPLGVFAHEFSHDLGLVDLYDTDGSSKGIGDWGIMAGGAWLGNPAGSNPSHPCAWSKMKLGWVEPIVVDRPLTAEDIPQVETNPVVYKLQIRSSSAGDEYFLVVNREKFGFDSSLPGQGLLIWHIDETRENNDDEFHRMVDLEEADEINGDNPTQSTDPWFDNSEGFGPDSIPDSSAYGNIRTGWKVKNIGSAGPTMVADITKEVANDVAISQVFKKRFDQVGTPISLTATVVNRGTLGQEDLNVSLAVYFNNYSKASLTHEEWATIATLESKAQTNLTWTFNPAQLGKYIFEVFVNLTEDEIPENNDRVVHVTVTSIFLRDDVEQGNIGWSTNPGNSAWRWKIVDSKEELGDSHSPTHSWRFGFYLGGNILLRYEHCFLRMNNVLVKGDAAHLTFWHKYNLGRLLEFRPGLEGHILKESDTASVQISVDGGPLVEIARFRGIQDVWKRIDIDISSYLNGSSSNVTLVFNVTANVLINKGGWWVDDIALVASPLSSGLVFKTYDKEKTGGTGGTVGYLLKVTNIGDANDSYTFTIGDFPQGWQVYLSQNGSISMPLDDFVLDLESDQESTIVLSVLIPQNAGEGERIDFSVVAASTRDPSQTASVNLSLRIAENLFLKALYQLLILILVMAVILSLVALAVSRLKHRR